MHPGLPSTSAQFVVPEEAPILVTSRKLLAVLINHLLINTLLLKQDSLVYTLLFQCKFNKQHTSYFDY